VHRSTPRAPLCVSVGVCVWVQRSCVWMRKINTAPAPHLWALWTRWPFGGCYTYIYARYGIRIILLLLKAPLCVYYMRVYITSTSVEMTQLSYSRPLRRPYTRIYIYIYSGVSRIRRYLYIYAGVEARIAIKWGK